MKTLRKECVRCKEEMKTQYINRKEQVYACPSCDSVSSIFEERDFIDKEKNLEQPKGIRYEYLASDLHIYLEQLPTNNPLWMILMLGVFMVCSVLAIFKNTHEDLTVVYIYVCFFMFVFLCLVVFHWRAKTRTYEIEVTPYRVSFFAISIWRKHLLKEVNSYEVDRIFIKTTAPPGTKSQKATDFMVQTKQYERIKPFHNSTGKEAELVYLKLLMDTYLNIGERVSDISTD